MAKKVREILFILEAHGWREVRQRGSHRQFRHPHHPLTLTVSGKRGDTMTIGQLMDIKRKSGIEELR